MENKIPGTAKKCLSYIIQSIEISISEPEKESIAYWLVESMMALSRTDVMLDKPVAVSPELGQRVGNAIDRLNANEPIQYILGETEFYEGVFKVSPDVLIPRPETEELVDLIVKENREEGLVILDIGTGSGCIPISVKKALPKAKVYAIDVSEGALDIARQNAVLNHADVEFILMDILKGKLPIDQVDVMVSNPPYVLESEKAMMLSNVLDYEPDLALFVKDNDPLVFYMCIVNHAVSHLSPSGKLYFEINEKYGEEVKELMLLGGFENVRVVQDLHGKDRMVAGVLKG